jgi:ribosomal protein L15E
MTAKRKSKPVWEKPRPKSLGKSKKLTPAQKESAKAAAQKAGRKYPNLVDNMRAAKKK